MVDGIQELRSPIKNRYPRRRAQIKCPTSESFIRRSGCLHQRLTIPSCFLNIDAIHWRVNKKQIFHPTDCSQARILNIEQARDLLAEGWAAADLHAHTLHSYDVIPTRQVDPLMLYQKAQRLGMTYIAFTDHDSMDAYDQIGWTREGLVPAVEVKILDPKKVGHTVHINVFGLDRGQFCEILKIARIARDLERLVAYFKDEHLRFTFNHPFWHEPGEKPSLRAILDIVDLFPVLEYNMGRIARINRQALRLAQAKGRGIVATTDTHVGAIGRAFTIARGGTFMEFFDQIQIGQSFIVPVDLSLSRFKEEAIIRIRQLFDKASWICPKDSFAIDTGSALLDGIIARIAQAHPDTPRFSNKIIEIILKAASRSGIPGSLYFRSQQKLADQIGGFLGNTEIAA
jgi:predicted metal-dependent phosphoesterase TrpH